MTSHELARRLLSGPDLEVTILDGFNGGGDPRTINLGPNVRDVNTEHAGYCTDDIETKSGNVVMIGFGCY
jgi:hypothetical protein|tara:strand:+ start:1033 stop:1242 length:210 start_codon:yes stop_codon:yes gene_type:complete